MEIERGDMVTKKEKWDGKSRPSTDKYRNNFNKIFGKKKPEVAEHEHANKVHAKTMKVRNNEK